MYVVRQNNIVLIKQQENRLLTKEQSIKYSYTSQKQPSKKIVSSNRIERCGEIKDETIKSTAEVGLGLAWTMKNKWMSLNYYGFSIGIEYSISSNSIYVQIFL